MARTYKYQKIKNSVKQQSTEALVEQFNALVGKRYWASARAAHDAALMTEVLMSLPSMMVLVFRSENMLF